MIIIAINFISPSYGVVGINDIVRIMADFIKQHGTSEKYELCIGTDSQNFSYTKMVMVITLRHIGHGGIFFYRVERTRRIQNIKDKLTEETTRSLLCAQQLIDAIEQLELEEDINILDYAHFCIHVDAGKAGRSKEMISEICGWVTACGYDVATKPNSYAASGVANRISK